jgi:hypothetical protein
MSNDEVIANGNGLEGYDEFLREIKGRIQAAQTRAALALSREVVLLYWSRSKKIFWIARSGMVWERMLHNGLPRI